MKKRKPKKQENSLAEWSRIIKNMGTTNKKIRPTKQQTVLIFDQYGEQPICFIVVDGDCRKYNGCYINTDHENSDDLGRFLYTEDGEFKHKKLKKFPRKAVKRGAYVIVCGFIP